MLCMQRFGLRLKALNLTLHTRLLSADCKVGLFGVLEDRNSSSLRGPALGPPKIREEFHSNAYNGHSELGMDVRSGGYIVDHGDVEIPEHSHALLQERVDKIMATVVQGGQIPLALGGDHSITYPLTKAIRAHHTTPFAIVHFDAHPDIYDAFEGDRYSHASPFARIMESTNPVICDKLLQVGIRTATPHQRQQMRRFKTKTVDAKDFPANAGEMKYIFDTYLPEGSLVYISFDMDVLDPAFAPGVSHRECGGLTTRQAIDAIFSIPGRIIGADVVEYNPEKDLDDVTAATTAKIVQEIIGKIIHSNTIGGATKP